MQDLSYPRPLLRRERWLSLDGPWRFAFDGEGRWRIPDDVPGWPHVIEVPFAPECARSGIGDQGFHRAVWYEREFEIAPELLEEGRRAILHFGAVDYHARVWINGVPVAEHEGGHTPFSADITFALVPGSPQKVTVWAEDDPQDLEKPRGKQDWRLHPHSIWYPRTTGIWQTVWLESVPPTYVSTLRWTPSVERWEIAFTAIIAGDTSGEFSVRVKLGCGPRVLADDTYSVIGGEVHRRMSLSDPGIDDYRNELLWSPETPTLLDAEVYLMRNGQVLDAIQSYTALRSIAVRREKVLLNGRPYSMRLVLDQGYWPDTFMTPPSERALREDVVLAKSMGFNGVRKHQKLEDPRYLYWADVLGLLVWDEMPSAYRFTDKSIKRLMREWTEAIDRDMSHPCVVIWVPFNESWGVPELSTTPAPRDAVAAFYHLTRTLDPSRLVVGNDGWESSATDVIGIHDYDSDPEHMHVRYGPEVTPKELVDQRWTAGRLLTLDGFPHRGQPICLTEFGGVAFIPGTPEYGDRNWGYSRARTEQEFERLVCGVIEAARTTGMFSGFCYTQFADTFQEVNGLLYADRTPKIDIEKIAAAVRGRGP
ncbi:MAG TPA: glycoside hydrolase family 2 TIM barrel-domain containing protein [Steroidobacteraceae bacterium]